MDKSVTLRRGFTLLEVIIYLALFAVIITGVVQTVYVLLETSRETAVSLAIQQNGSFVLEKIAAALGDVDTITTDGSTWLEIKPTVITSPTLHFTVVDNRWYLTRGNGDPTPLTNSFYTVHDVMFDLTHPTPESNYLKVSFRINDAPFSLTWPGYE